MTMILIDNEDGDDEDDTLFYNIGIDALKREKLMMIRLVM